MVCSWSAAVATGGGSAFRISGCTGEGAPRTEAGNAEGILGFIGMKEILTEYKEI
jgi:hypothetical protein